MRTLALLGVVAALTACPVAQPADGGKGICPQLIADSHSLPTSSVPATIGMPWTATFGASFHTCDGSPVDPNPPVQVQVFDPDNRSVPFMLAVESSSAPTAQDDHRDFLAHVTFIPLRLGVYHLVVRFEPEDSPLQSDVSIAEDRRPALFKLLPVPYPCEDVAVQGAVTLCLSARIVHVFSGANEVDSFPACAFALSDGELWSLDVEPGSEGLELDTLSDTGVRTVKARVDLSVSLIAAAPQLGLATLVASKDRVALVAHPYLQELWFDGQMHFEPVVDQPIEIPVAVRWQPDASAIIAGELTPPLSLPDASVCVVQLSDGGRACVSQRALGDEGHALLSTDGTSVTAWSFTDSGALSRQSAGSFDPAFTSLTTNGKLTGPVARALPPYGIELYVLDSSPHVAVYGPPPSGSGVTPSLWGLTADWYWQSSLDAGLMLMSR